MGLNAILHMTAQFLSWQCNVEKCYYKNDTICSGLDLRGDIQKFICIYYNYI